MLGILKLDFEAVPRQTLTAYYCTYYLGCFDRQPGKVRQTGTDFRHNSLR